MNLTVTAFEYSILTLDIENYNLCLLDRLHSQHEFGRHRCKIADGTQAFTFSLSGVYFL